MLTIMDVLLMRISCCFDLVLIIGIPHEYQRSLVSKQIQENILSWKYNFLSKYKLPMFPSQCCLAESPLSDGLIVEGEPAKVFQNLDALSRNNDIKDARIMIELW